MEIVKKIEGPGNEELTDDFNFDSEKEYLEKDNEKERSSKGFFFTLGGMTIISILGYVGYTKLQTPNNIENKQTLITKSIVEKNSSDNKIIPPVQVKKIMPTPKEPITTETTPTVPIKEKTKKVVLYTEELALAHVGEAKPSVIKPKVKQIPLTQPIVKTKPIPVTVEKKVEKKVVKQKVNKVSSKRKSMVKKRRIVIVKKGDTLALLAQKFYGNPMEFKRIIRANRKIRSHKTNLKVGQKVIIPYMPKNKRRRYVTVKKGYSLAYISKKFYGTTAKIDKIVAANYNIKNKKTPLRIGQKVYVPR